MSDARTITIASTIAIAVPAICAAAYVILKAAF